MRRIAMNGKRKSLSVSVDDLKQIVIDKDETIWSVQSFAEYLGISNQAVRKRIHRGLIPAHKSGRSWFILKSEYVKNLREK